MPESKGTAGRVQGAPGAELQLPFPRWLDIAPKLLQHSAVASIEVRALHKVFRQANGELLCAVDHLSFAVQGGEFVTVVGPSGSGKTTLLRIIAGLESPDAGAVLIDGRDVTQAEPHEREVAMVFQEGALLPHLTARENISLGLSLRRTDPAEAERRVNQVMEVLGLTRLVNRLPREISGGEQKRVALARALVRKPAVMLLDEPLANLDAPLRMQLRIEMARVAAELGTTMLYVTHDQGEAVSLGHRVLVLREGTLQQFGAPSQLYNAPANAFVAGFVGLPPMNLLRGRVVADNGAYLFRENNPAGAAEGRRLELPLDDARGARLASFAGGNVILGIRSQHVCTGVDARAGACLIEVLLSEPLGRETLLHLTTGAHRLVACAPGTFCPRPGERIPVAVDLQQAIFFNPASEKVIV